LAAGVRPISRTSPSTCAKIKYSNRNDTLGSCPTSDHRWSATQARLLAPHTPLGAKATAVSELLWGSIPMVITGYLRVAVMGSPATGNLT